jgi:hypothetical protein
LQQAATDPDWPEQTTNIAVIITAIVNSTSTGGGGGGRNSSRRSIAVATNVGVLVVEWPRVQEYCRGVMAARHFTLWNRFGILV